MQQQHCPAYMNTLHTFTYFRLTHIFLTLVFAAGGRRLQKPSTASEAQLADGVLIALQKHIITYLLITIQSENT